MTEPDRIDEELLKELGLGKPELEGDSWDLERLEDRETPPEDFLETLDAIQLLHDLGQLDIQQNPPKLDPPKDCGKANPVQQLLELLQQQPKQEKAVDNPDAPKLDPPDFSQISTDSV